MGNNGSDLRWAHEAAQRAEEEANRARAAQEEADRARWRAEEEGNRARAAHEEADRARWRAEEDANRARAAQEGAERNARAAREEAERARQRAEEEARRDKLAREESERNASALREADRARQMAEEEAARDKLAREEAERNERAMRDQAERDQAMADENIRNARIAQDHAEQERQRAEDDAKRAIAEREELDRAKQRAEEEAVRQKEAREEGERKARVDQEEADRKRQDAERERQEAEENARIANAAQAEAERKRKVADDDALKAKASQEAAERAEKKAQDESREAREAAEDARVKLEQGIHPVVWPTAHEMEEVKRHFNYVEGTLHFAVVGIAGSGKSSLINAFRGIRNKGVSSAPTGVVETTQSTTRYPDPDRNRPFVWYDVPGAGTLSIPDWMYFNQQGLYVFDCIIVLFDNRFTATDIAILQNCARFKIPSYIVRSKSDQHVLNMTNDMEDEDEDDQISAAERKKAARETFIAETRQSVVDNLKMAEMPAQRVYIISKDTLLRIVKDKPSGDIMDENELLMDILTESTRGGGVTARVAITARSNDPFEDANNRPANIDLKDQGRDGPSDIVKE